MKKRVNICLWRILINEEEGEHVLVEDINQ